MATPLRSILYALLLLVGAGTLAAAPSTRATAVRVTTAGDSARVVIDLSGNTRFKMFTLDSPSRIVVDIADTALAAKGPLPAGAGPIARVRAGVQPNDTLRLVIETRVRTSPQALLASPAAGEGHRLIVDIAGSGARGAPILAAAPTTSAPATAPAAAPVVAPAPAAASAPSRPVVAKHFPQDTGRDVVVAVDAGHGGKDPGAIGRGGTREKDVVLSIAREVVERINREPGMKAILVRDGDYYVAHRERIRRARTANADLFVSIHADSVGNPDVSGSSVYVLSERGATDEAARWLAERENAADLIGGVSLSDKDNGLASVLLDLSQTANITASMRVAERVLQSIDRVGEVRKPRVQQAGFLVLKSPDVPSILVETAFISNRGDERRLGTVAYRNKLADAIVGGVRNHFTDNPPEGSRFAQVRRLATTSP